jgi:hypothetical protein
MRNTTLMLLLASLLALTACKQDANEPGAANADATPAPSGMLGAATDKVKARAAAAAVPQPDASKPLSSYPELESGQQIMFLYVAASRLPPDFAKLAEAFSSEYRETSDSFRKNDLMQAIRPQLEEKIALAKAAPYGWMEIEDSDNLGAYDFERKGFPVGEFEDSKYRYFNDNYNYKIGWANYSQLAFIPVADEATARQIEAMRSNYGNTPRLKVYFFAQSADLDNERVNAVVTRVQVTDKSGRVLAEYGPDGSVLPTNATNSEESACGTGDAAACDAAQAAVNSAS